MKTDKSKVSPRTSKKLIATLLLVVILLVIFARPVRAIITMRFYWIIMVVLIGLTILALSARWKKTTIGGLAKSFFFMLDEEEEGNSKSSEGAKESDGWAPIDHIDKEEGEIYLLNKDGVLKHRPIPPDGKKYDADLNLVALPKTTEELVDELLKNQQEMEKRIEALEKKSSGKK